MEAASISKLSVKKAVSVVYRYGMLVIILALLAKWVVWFEKLNATYAGDRYSTGVVSLMLLFNHLAFAFEWSKQVAQVLRLVAFAWLAFGFFYISYWNHVL